MKTISENLQLLEMNIGFYDKAKNDIRAVDRMFLSIIGGVLLLVQFMVNSSEIQFVDGVFFAKCSLLFLICVCVFWVLIYAIACVRINKMLDSLLAISSRLNEEFGMEFALGSVSSKTTNWLHLFVPLIAAVGVFLGYI